MRRILPLGSLLVVLAAAPLAAQTATAPTGGANVVAAANDFATTTWQDPWDMNQRTDLGWWLNSIDYPPSGFSSFNFAGGLFTGTVSADPNVFLLETGHPGVAPVGKFGAEYPIDANKYRVAAIRMRVPTSNYMLFLWGTNTLAQGISYSNAVTTTSGWRIYVVDLATLGILAGNEQWNGTKRFLRLDPAPDNELAGGVIDIDWVRLVENQPSLFRTITWSGGGAVDIYLDNDSSQANGNLGLVAPNVGSIQNRSYSLNVGALQPGDYYVALRAAGTTNALSYSSGFYRVNAPATITLTAPSDEGSTDDFATVQLNNPWDFTSLSDIDYLWNIQGGGIYTMPNIETEGGTQLGSITAFGGSNTGGAQGGPCASFSKPVIFPFHSTVRGQTRRIDPNRYRILTAELGIQNKARDICGGSIVRIGWHVAGAANESYSNDIILNSRLGANVMARLNMDMATLELETDIPGQAGWVPGVSPNPGIMSLRIDPHEFFPTTGFFMKRLKLAALDVAHTSFTVRWTTSKTGGTINVYYDVDKNPANGRSLVGSTAASAVNGSLSWNTAGLPDGAHYYVYVEHNDGTNANGAYSKWPVVIDHTPNTARLVLNRSRLNFGVLAGSIKTPPQELRLSVLNAPAGTPCWTATSDLPFLVVSPSAGCGATTLTVSLIGGHINQLGDYAGSIRIASPNANNSPQSVPAYVSLKSFSQPPSGAVDTPANGVIVSGSLGVTGWAIDDIGVARVTICRAPVAGEGVPPNASCGANQLYLGDAVLISDARPDIEGYSPTSPQNYRAGWGFLVLTNMLPGGGNGVFTLHMNAIDLEGRQGALGSRVIDVRNSTAVAPFGAIDTPGQGETIGGTNYANFGWVLSRVRPVQPPNGAVYVFIDGLAVGSPGGWVARADLMGLFPNHPGVNRALGVYNFNTLAYANGLHTISWLVIDNQNSSAGVGSRFFSVFNAGAALTEASAGSAMRPAGPDLGRRLEDLDGRTVAAAVGVREGFGLTTPIRAASLGIDGTRRVSTMERDRIEIRLEPSPAGLDAGARTISAAMSEATSRSASKPDRYAGYLVVNGELRELPTGSSFDPSRGAFYWQPGLGYVGSYDLLFVRTGADGARERIPVRVSLQDRPTNALASRLSGPWAGVTF